MDNKILELDYLYFFKVELGCVFTHICMYIYTHTQCYFFRLKLKCIVTKWVN